MTTYHRHLLMTALHAGLAAAHPHTLIGRSALIAQARAAPGSGRTIVLALGKAGAAMAASLCDLWPDTEQLEGVVVAQVAEQQPAQGLVMLVGDHPLPGLRSQRAAAEVADALIGLTSADRVIALISGGSSSLLFDPLPPLTLQDCNPSMAALMATGANIAALNTVRRHLSRLAGGRLAQMAMPAEVLALVLSDVPGDDIALVGSGPVSADPTTLANARAVFERHGIKLPSALAAALRDPCFETPKPGNAAFSRVQTECIGAAVWMPAAETVLQAAGYTTRSLGAHREGEAQSLARDHAAAALDAVRLGRRIALLSGGEATTVRRGNGRGGANTEFALWLALVLDGHANVRAVAVDSDGLDGTAGAAGAIIGPDTLARAAALGCNARNHAARSDSASYFSALGDLIIIGPTQTNVNDIRILLIDPHP